MDCRLDDKSDLQFFVCIGEGKMAIAKVSGSSVLGIV